MSATAPVRNVLKAWLLLAAVCAALGGIAWAIDGSTRVISFFVFCGLLLGTGFYWSAERLVLGMAGAEELPEAKAPAVHAAVERLAARAGIVKPRIHLIDDGFPRALAAGRGPASSALAVSAGLIAIPAPAELEGLLAHEIAHIRNRDVLVQAAAVTIAAAIVEISRIGGFFQRALLFVLGPVAAAFVHLLLSPKREFEADRIAAELCDSPHGLADALIRLEQASEMVEFRASPATEPLYPFNPFGPDRLARMFDTHPPVGERVRRLRALDPDWRQRLHAA